MCLFVDSIQFCILRNATTNESAAHRSNRVTGAIGLFLFFGTIQYGVALKVAVVAIGLTFDQAGTFTTPCARNSFTSSLVNRKDIQSVDCDAWHVVACCPISDITAAHVIGNRRGFSITIIFGNKNYWKLPDSGKIESFMELPL